MTQEQVKRWVQERYTKVAQGASDVCCEKGAETWRVERLYSPQELQSLPVEAIAGAAGCGNPTALGEIRPGEVVLDLGSGGGIDCFLAARQVGPTGRVIGVDMTSAMLELARRNAEKLHATNVTFLEGELDRLPVEDSSVDVIISNCVINLAPDKEAVFREAFRVLRPGGRLYVSDVVTDGELSPEVRDDPQAWAACVAGAEPQEVYLGHLHDVGFVDISASSKGEHAAGCDNCGVFSLNVKAVRPGV